ncbi:hypothetical protein N7524_008648 [Penicillium chrysogenum]|nr:hypothetical protein N7524_008648 [Penicillium chrysogenum]
MIETLEPSSNDADLKTLKRTLGETDLDQNPCPLRRVRARCEKGEVLPDTTSEKAPHVELQDKPFTSECFELQPAFDAVDMFAPLLFHDYSPPPIDNFDPPFFEASSSLGHTTQLGGGDPVGFCADITDPILETEFRFAWDGK